MHFTSTIVLLALGFVASTTAAPNERRGIQIPENLPDGHYFSDGSIDPKTGLATYTFLGPIDWKKVADTKAAIAADSIKRIDNGNIKRGEGPNCNGRNGGGSVGDAAAAFAATLDISADHRGTWWSSVGNTKAYACVYDAPTIIKRDVFWADHANIDNACGTDNAGWFRHETGGIDYGRDSLSFKVCAF